MTEERPYITVGSRSEMGRSSVDIECPFCGAVVRAYLWSLAGGGKLCPCGVKFTSFGVARRR